MPSKYKSIELDGDLDLFGDNSIYIHRTVSHTPGSQIMVVRLPKTGTVVLTSDAVYLQENLDKDILPSVGSVYDPVGMLDAYAWVKRVRDVEGADIIYAHDPDISKPTSTLPEYLRVIAQQSWLAVTSNPGLRARDCVGWITRAIVCGPWLFCKSRCLPLCWRSMYQMVRAAPRRDRRFFCYRAGRDRRPARAQRLRQEHDLPHAHGLSCTHFRAHRGSWP